MLQSIENIELINNFKNALLVEASTYGVEAPTIHVREFDDKVKIEGWNTSIYTLDELRQDTQGIVESLIAEQQEFKYHKNQYSRTFKSPENITIGHGYSARTIKCNAETKQALGGVYRVHYSGPINQALGVIGRTYTDVLEFKAREAVEYSYRYVRNEVYPISVEYLGTEQGYGELISKASDESGLKRHSLFEIGG